MLKKSLLQHIFTALIFACLTASMAFAQTTAFNFQGKLTDTGTPQSTYQMSFALYDLLVGGSQIGATVTNSSVTVADGVFSLQLDFGAAAFDGTDRFLEIAVRKSPNDNWTVLSSRQPISATPYSIKSVNSTTADSLSEACVGCVQDANINDISGSKVIGQIPSQSVPTGSGNYIQNAATALRLGQNPVQDAAGFNIDGNGIIGDSLGIGIVPRTGIKLDVIGTALISPIGAGIMQFGNPNSETGMTTIVGNGRADLRYDGTTLKLVAGIVGGPPSSTNGIIISNAGNVGIGAIFPTPLYKLSVVGNTGITGNLSISGATTISNGLTVGSGNVVISDHATIDNGLTVFNGASIDGNVTVNRGNLAVSGRVFIGVTGQGGDESICRNSATGALSACSSSLRYKSNVEGFGQGLNILNRLRPIRFTWNQTGQPDIGFGAEDVAKINPLFVTFNDKGEVEGVKYDRLSVVFVNAFQELQTQIVAQQKQLEQQQTQIETLKKLICLDHPNADICREK